MSTQNIKIDKVAGTLQTDATITNRTPQPWSHFTAMLRSTLVLKDGELFGVGYVDAAHGGDRSTIVGGTGAYSGASGTVVGSENGAVITLGSLDPGARNDGGHHPDHISVRTHASGRRL